MRLNITNDSVSTLNYNGFEVETLIYNTVEVWKKGGSSFSYDYAVINTLGDKESNIQYQYNKKESKWYCLNNLNDLEPYGIIEAVDDIDSATHYNGKLVLQGDSEYEWSNNQWNYLGEKEGGFGEIGQISQDLRETDFPTDFYITTNDIEASGWFNIDMMLENDGSLSVDGSIGSLDYRIEYWNQGVNYNGTAEVEEIDGVQYVHFSCPDYPNDSVFVMDCMLWGEPITYYGSSIAYPKKYNAITYNTKDGYYYDSEDDVDAVGKNIVYNIDGYLYKNIDGTYERGNNGNPYAIDKAFSGDTKMSGSVKLLDEVIDTIGKSAFSACTSLSSVIIGNSVTSIGSSAFQGCRSLTSVTIPNSVTTINGSAFSACRSLTSIEIPDSVTSIRSNAFQYCISLTSVTIPNSVTSISGGAFQGCSSLTSITIPSGVTSIGNITFDGCSSLTSIEIPDSVTSIGDKAFISCISLTSVTIPNSVTSIGNYAFSNCRGLTSVTIGNSVTSIGYGAFNQVPTQGTLYCDSNWYNNLSSTMKTNLGNVYNWTKVFTDVGDDGDII